VAAAVHFVGSSSARRCLVGRLAESALTDVEILITGPTGVGKEFYAQHAHRQGPRAKAACLPVNCGAVPDSLLENELFGHVGGAFTGAKPQSAGLVGAAEGERFSSTRLTRSRHRGSL
jgi:transcriptional regulator with PAS, ATPase and Fis domain